MDRKLTCQVCRGAMRPLFQKHHHWICGCIDCGHRSADVGDPAGHVDRVYGNDYFQGGGAGYSDYLAVPYPGDDLFWALFRRQPAPAG